METLKRKMVHQKTNDSRPPTTQERVVRDGHLVLHPVESTFEKLSVDKQ